jgi:hypothetical protein
VSFFTARTLGSTNTMTPDYCIGRVKCTFRLPASANILFSAGRRVPPTYLAYVEWYTPFTNAPIGRHHGLYKISRHMAGGKVRASIIPITQIEQSVHLFPHFGSSTPVDWKSSNVLDLSQSFFVNPFSNRSQYLKLA